MQNSTLNLSASLDVTPEQYEKLAQLITKYLKQELIATPSLPAANLGAPFITEFNIEPNINFSKDGAPAEQILEQLLAKYQIGRRPIHPAHLCFLPGGGIEAAAFADLISSTMNRHTSFVENCPAIVDIEVCVLRWLCNLIYGKLEDSAPFGILTSGGSLANWSGLCIALNEKKRKLAETTKQHPLVLMSKFRIYINDQMHFCILKAAKLLGFTDDNIVTMTTNEQFTFDIKQLEEKIEKDKKSGWTPFVIVANAGATNTGAIDDLPAVASLAKRYDMWLHVDACFGGFYKLTEVGSRLLKGIEHCDSVSLDPHKGLFLPCGTGCLLVRDIHTMKRAFSSSALAPYLNSHAEAEDKISIDDLNYYDIADMGPELTRPFRGLRLWLPLKLHGVAAFEKAASDRLELAQYFHHQLMKKFGSRVQVLHEPTLSVVVFRFVEPGDTEEVIRTRTRQVLNFINTRNKIAIFTTTAKGKFAFRVIFSSFRATREVVDTCIHEFVLACESCSGNLLP